MPHNDLLWLHLGDNQGSDLRPLADKQTLFVEGNQ